MLVITSLVCVGMYLLTALVMCGFDEPESRVVRVFVYFIGGPLLWLQLCAHYYREIRETEGGVILWAVKHFFNTSRNKLAESVVELGEELELLKKTNLSLSDEILAAEKLKHELEKAHRELMPERNNKIRRLRV